MASYSLPTGAGCVNKVASGISSIYTDFVESAVDYTYEFSHLIDGMVESESVDVRDQYGRQRSPGTIYRIKGTSVELAGTVANLEALAKFSTCTHYPFAKTNSGQEFHLGNATVGYAGSPKWKLIISGKFNEKRVVEFEWQRFVNNTSAVASVLDETIVQTTAAEGIGAGLGATTGATAQIKTLEVRNAGETIWEALDFINGNFTAEHVTLPPDSDPGNRHQTALQIKIMSEFELTAATQAALTALTLVRESTSNDVRITCSDGVVFTFADNLGVKLGLSYPAKVGDIMKSQATFEGTILTSAWAGIVS